MSFGHVSSRLKIKLYDVKLRRGLSVALGDSGRLVTAIYHDPSAVLADRSS